MGVVPNMLSTLVELDASGFLIVTHPAVVWLLDLAPLQQMVVCGVIVLLCFSLYFAAIELLGLGSKLGIAPVDSASEATVFSHAAVSSALAAILMYNTGGQMTCVTPPHALDRLSLIITGGYMWAHLVIMKIVWSSPLARKNKAHAYNTDVKLMILHHVGIFLFFEEALRRNVGVTVCAYMCFTEASTMFITMGSEMAKRGYGNSKLFILNGGCLLLSFFLCRILFSPWVWHRFVIEENLCAMHFPWWFACAAFVGITGLFCLNLYWFRFLVGLAIEKVVHKKTIEAIAKKE